MLTGGEAGREVVLTILLYAILVEVGRGLIALHIAVGHGLVQMVAAELAHQVAEDIVTLQRLRVQIADIVSAEVSCFVFH